LNIAGEIFVNSLIFHLLLVLKKEIASAVNVIRNRTASLRAGPFAFQGQATLV
jgi:hypothetical protein